MSFLLSLVTMLPMASPLEAETLTLRLDPLHTKIRFSLGATGHTVEGALHLTSGEVELNLESGTASGLLVLDSKRVSTFHEKRDDRMHRDVLKSAVFPQILFTPTKCSGTLPTAKNPKSWLELWGDLSLLGAAHPSKLKVQMERLGPETVRATTQFEVPYVDWGLTDPSVFILRVAKTIDVSVTTEGHIKSTESPTIP